MKLFVLILALAVVACATPVENVESVQSIQNTDVLELSENNDVASVTRNKRLIDKLILLYLGAYLQRRRQENSVTGGNRKYHSNGGYDKGNGGEYYRPIFLQRVNDNGGRYEGAWEEH